MQVIFHIDINAFFASAEISQDPSLANKPLVIAGKSKRSIVTTASYEARKLGIHSAMPVFQARKLCPNIMIRPGNYALYHRLSQAFFTIIATYSEILEVASIDECYVDMTSYICDHKIYPEALAMQIQKDVLEQLQLPVSIGIAPNKFLAKMASNMKKPLGITVIIRSDIRSKIWPLSIEKMHGIGKQTQPKLYELNIHTIGDIANYNNYETLRTIYKKRAILLYRKANGIDTSKIIASHNQLKSVGNSHTLDANTSNETILLDVIRALSLQVSSRAQKRNLLSNTVSITIKYATFESITRQTKTHKYINDFETILATAKGLFMAYYTGKPVRLLGVSILNTIHKENYTEQLSFYDDVEAEEIKARTNINTIITNINDQLQSTVVQKASDIVDKHHVQKKYIREDE